MSANARGRCRLCLQERQLRESHIIPAFFMRWIKKDAPGTVFQNLASGDVRQDASKRRLLCGSCEQLLSPLENKFRNRVFDPYMRGRLNFARADWLTRFTTSLAFRVATVTLPDVPLSISRRAQVASLLEAWRQFLLAPAGAKVPSVHELLFLNGRTVIPPRGFGPEQISKYFWTCIDPSVIASATVLGVYTKLPGMLIWSPIGQQQRSGWRGTKVDGVGTIRGNKQSVTAPFLTNLMADRIHQIVVKHGEL